MPHPSMTQRSSMKSSLAGAGATVLTSRLSRAGGFVLANDCPRVGAIGTGSR